MGNSSNRHEFLTSKTLREFSLLCADMESNTGGVDVFPQQLNSCIPIHVFASCVADTLQSAISNACFALGAQETTTGNTFTLRILVAGSTQYILLAALDHSVKL